MRIFALILLVGCLSGCQPPVPSLAGGKPLQYWLEKLHDRDVQLRQQAVHKLGNVGAPEATILPALLEKLHDPDAGVRRAAIIAVVKFGSDAQEAIPVLHELARRDPDKGVRESAPKAIACLEANSAAN